MEMVQRKSSGIKILMAMDIYIFLICTVERGEYILYNGGFL